MVQRALDLLPIRCETTQAGVYDISISIQRHCQLQSDERCITIASACNVAYRKQWMPAHKIAVEPVRGW